MASRMEIKQKRDRNSDGKKVRKDSKSNEAAPQRKTGLSPGNSATNLLEPEDDEYYAVESVYGPGPDQLGIAPCQHRFEQSINRIELLN